MREAVGWQTKQQLYRAYRYGRSGCSQTRMLLMSGTVFFAGSAEYQVGSLGASSCSECRKGRSEGGLVAGGLTPRGASFSGDAVGILELGTCRGQWHQPPVPGRTSQGHLKADPVQTSAEEFGISLVEVPSPRDMVVESKELNGSPFSLVQVLISPQTRSVNLGHSLPLSEPHFHLQLENWGFG